MTFKRRDFKMSAYSAERVSDLEWMQKHNLGPGDDLIRPFKLSWPKRHMEGEASRFVMPSLRFDNEEVARLGFRGTQGFIMIRQGLSEQAAHVIENRFMRLIDLAKNNAKVIQEEKRFMLEAVSQVFGEKNIIRDYNVKEVPLGFTDSRNILRAAFSNFSHAFWTESQRSMKFVMRQPAFNLNLPVIDVSQGSVVEKHTTWKMLVSAHSKNMFDLETVKPLIREFHNSVPEGLSDIVSRRFKSDQGDVNSVGHLLKQKDWDGRLDEEGFSVHKDHGSLVLRHSNLDLATFALGKGQILCLDASAAVKISQNPEHKLAVIAASVVRGAFSKKKPKTTDEMWIERMEASLSEIDPGYS